MCRVLGRPFVCRARRPAWPALLGQSYQIAAQAFALDGQLQVRVNLVQVRTDSQEDAARTQRGKAAFVKTLAQLHDGFDAIGLGLQAAAAKRVNINLVARILVTAKEMAGKTDARDRQPQPARKQKVNDA